MKNPLPYLIILRLWMSIQSGRWFSEIVSSIFSRYCLSASSIRSATVRRRIEIPVRMMIAPKISASALSIQPIRVM